MEQLEKKAKSLQLHLWPRAEQGKTTFSFNLTHNKGHVLGKEEEEDEEIVMDDEQEIDELVELHNQIDILENNEQDPVHFIYIFSNCA